MTDIDSPQGRKKLEDLLRDTGLEKVESEAAVNLKARLAALMAEIESIEAPYGSAQSAIASRAGYPVGRVYEGS